MSATGLTYVTILDYDQGDPIQQGGMQVFASYNEAMSYGKFITSTVTNHVRIVIWNELGGSGLWSFGNWNPIPNTNWPE